MGMIYKRGEVFWIKYYSGCKPIRESTGTTKQKEAERLLKHREGRSATGLQPLPCVDRITYDELARDLRLHYETTGTRGLKEADTRFQAVCVTTIAPRNGASRTSSMYLASWKICRTDAG